jgi:hypothetical protein
VGRDARFHCTTELGTNPLPVTVKEKAGSPAVAVPGEIPFIAGVGVGTSALNVSELEMPPPGAGLKTVIWLVEANEMSVAVMAARNWEAVTKLVVRSFPFQRTAEPGTKPVPFTVI